MNDSIGSITHVSTDANGNSFDSFEIVTSATEDHTLTDRAVKLVINMIKNGDTLTEVLEVLGGLFNVKDDLVIEIDKTFYIGQPNVDGSFRFLESTGELTFEKRVAGVWETYFVGAKPVLVESIAINTSAVYDRIYICTSAITVTLPVPTAHEKLTIKNMSGGEVTLARNGTESIDGVASNLVMSSVNESLTLVSNGTNWFII